MTIWQCLFSDRTTLEIALVDERFLDGEIFNLFSAQQCTAAAAILCWAKFLGGLDSETLKNCVNLHFLKWKHIISSFHSAKLPIVVQATNSSVSPSSASAFAYLLPSSFFKLLQGLEIETFSKSSPPEFQRLRGDSWWCISVFSHLASSSWKKPFLQYIYK